ncbi:MIP/aquaporin family protein [Alicyclobacillus acidoterrestris]|uniref:Aquaporin family protein n=1 Tax=Alicyclobacillus acidoterrestris (strain ATCC 49025 / DSM 3922 / CIP 106132 / NCIMB 13137 / GD3B) TaxID=1356854 RepID=T0BQW5_ALIAG|nr:MIP/aquaporin family protein [Alicyclobacillus acidoterrestris]EPZ42940.1 glycerol transporter [Alicyclobacillus acidoterrestris ATCC 49025]UNO50043.1 aquaporin family protein [Alicyclobacillus acidoterrestris]GEO25245.1 aquaporin [Alicyclobacillus acidoterrestris]
MRNSFLGECIAEIIGTAFMIMVGDSVAAMAVLYNSFSGDYWGICILWGLGVTMAVYLVGAISGAHLNPAVTVGFAMYGGFPWKKVPGFIVSQGIGAFLGAGLTYTLFSPVINAYNAAHHAARAATTGLTTSGIFFTHPSAGITTGHAFVDEIILTGALVIGILALSDTYNTNTPRGNITPLIVGLLVAMVGGFGGQLEAWALNPARDFGPRLFAWMMGWGQNAFPGPGNFWWVPIVAPIVGAVVAGALYTYVLRPFMPGNPARVKASGLTPKRLEA